MIGDPEFLHYVDPKGDWPDLQSPVEVEAIRRQGNKVTTTTRYFISTHPPQAVPLLAATRDHWRIENSLHWVLDVAFREDESRLRKSHVARNMAVIRRLANSLLRRDTQTRMGIANKRLKAGRNSAYMERILLT